MTIDELLIDFDEMGFVSTTLCENPDEYAQDWKNQLLVEIKRLKDDYSKLQEQFAQYQIASEKEIIAQKKQAVKEFAEKLKKCSYTDNCFTDGKWHRYVLVSDIDELLREYKNGKQI